MILPPPVAPIDKGGPASYLLDRLAGSVLVIEPGMWRIRRKGDLQKERSKDLSSHNEEFRENRKRARRCKRYETSRETVLWATMASAQRDTRPLVFQRDGREGEGVGWKTPSGSGPIKALDSADSSGTRKPEDSPAGDLIGLRSRGRRNFAGIPSRRVSVFPP